MIKEKLIKELQKLPAGTNVVIADYKKNLAADMGEGSSEGLYPEFKIEYLGKDQVTDTSKPFAALVIPQDEFEE